MTNADRIRAMTDEELNEVIENLEYLVSDSCTDTQFDYIEEIEIATKSLKKQIPQKVQKKHIDEYICPACGEENSGCDEGKITDRYCPKCGQRLGVKNEID